eukprot:Unigene13405_Nuclearia_a/m.40632 Unigene13405_Nuclearia_a/g.40632  ORF Unigene13405_Nuclearia_a/g.40632 Unigene13405_Nuclearia_a/m.40632 type:complete len:426 (+) Unigene13405_Nuclearia_a:1-1278(+)
MLHSSWLNVPLDARLPELREAARRLYEAYEAEIRVRRREGQWDQQETVQLGRTTSSPLSASASAAGVRDREDLQQRLQELQAALDNDNMPRFMSLLELDAEGHSGLLRKLARDQQVKLMDDAIQRKHKRAFEALLACCESDPCAETQSLLLEVLHSTVRQGFLDGLKLALPVCTRCGVDVNTQTRDGGNSVLHFAARRSDLAMVAELLAAGVQPLLLNSNGVTALSMLATRDFMQGELAASSVPAAHDLNVDRFLRSSDFSDVVLYGDDGVRIPAHRIILCAQSPVFDAMLRGRFVEATKSEIELPNTNARLIGLLLEYCYTGRCSYSRDDLATGIDMLRLAEQYLLPMLKRQAEEAMIRAVDGSNAVALSRALVGCDAQAVLSRCVFCMLTSYASIADDEQALQTLIDALGRVQPTRGTSALPR